MSAQAVQVLFGTTLTMAADRERAAITKTTATAAAAHAEKIRHALGTTTRIIAVGPKTRSKLEEFGLHADFMPAEYSSKGLTKMLSEMNSSGKKIIIPRSSAANDYAAKSLAALGMSVDEINLYSIRTVSEPSEGWRQFAARLAGGEVDAVVFTSASSVGAFFEIANTLLLNGDNDAVVNLLARVAHVISIGPFTTEQLRKRGVKCSESRVHTVKGTFELAKAVLMPK